jgi:hypothetical protein
MVSESMTILVRIEAEMISPYCNDLPFTKRRK